MNQEDLAVLADFEQVWLRVLGAEVPTVQTAEDVSVEEVLDCLQTMWCGYQSMARQAPPHLKRRLLELARRAKCRMGELQLEYFLETGDIHAPEISENFASCTMSNLRKIWQKASKLEQKLQSVQEQNHGKKRETLEAVREELQFQTAQLRQILACFFQ